MATSATTSALADIAQYMWSCDILKKNAFNNGALPMNNGRDIVLLLENNALAYGIEQGLDNILGETNYVYQLVGQMLQPANQVLTGGSGGGIVPPSGGGGSSVYFPINGNLTAGQISGMVISDITWKGLVQQSPTMTITDVQFTLGVDYTYNVVNGSFTFTSYNPQAGDSIGTFGFKTA